MRIQEIDKKLNQYLLKGEFGIEKESLRVDAAGHLAVTEHPQIDREQISRDFSESQVEFISGVYDNLQGACGEICMLQGMVEEAIANRPTGKEYMWTYSNPPLFDGEKNIQIAEFTGEKEARTTYREYLAQKYGKVKMLYSGVHLNYSMPREFFELLLEKVPEKSLDQMKSEWYVRLADVLMSDSWLIVALTAASPVAEEAFLRQLGVPKEEMQEYASFRNSQYGYWNLFVPELSYADFSSYLKSVDAYVAAGEISSIQELYYPVRLKPGGENSFENLCQNGVNHIELRMLDLNPMCCAGVAKRDLIFIHLLIAYRTAEILSTWRAGESVHTYRCFSSDGERILLHKQAARFSFWEEYAECREYALTLIRNMKNFFRAYGKMEGVTVPKDYPVSEVLEFQEKKILEPDKRYANQIRAKYQSNYIKTRMREIREG